MIPFLICYRTGIYHIVVLNVNILLDFVLKTIEFLSLEA